MRLAATTRGAIEPALVFAGVSVHARDRHGRQGPLLLQDIDWRIERGQHWAVLGSNGAGKTTLLRTAAGAIAPTSGTISVLGERHGAPSLRDPRLRIGVVQGTPPIFAGELTATDVVLLRAAGPVALHGARVSAEDRARASQLLRRFGGEAFRERRYGACSQGERQRIQLARTLMRDPSLLLYDEPASALDLTGREALIQAMARLAADRPELATVTITHHVEELPPSTTHALLLRDGAVVATGPVRATLTDEALSACFGVDVSVTRLGDRWTAQARPAW